MGSVHIAVVGAGGHTPGTLRECLAAALAYSTHGSTTQVQDDHRCASGHSKESGGSDWTSENVYITPQEGRAAKLDDRLELDLRVKSHSLLQLDTPPSSAGSLMSGQDAPSSPSLDREVLNSQDPKRGHAVSAHDPASEVLSALLTTWPLSNMRTLTSSSESDGHLWPIFSSMAVLLRRLGKTVEETCAQRHHWIPSTDASSSVDASMPQCSARHHSGLPFPAHGAGDAHGSELIDFSHAGKEFLDTVRLASLAATALLAEERFSGQCLPDNVACNWWSSKGKAKPKSLVEVRSHHHFT